MTARQKLLSWLASDRIDDVTASELMAIMDDEREVDQRFDTDLAFGTGDMRGIMRAGTNGMNKYTVAKITKALASCIKRRDGEMRGVVVGYDGRNNSEYFAKIVDAVLTENGIPCYLFNAMRPTPMLSFAVRIWRSMAGVMITASHNPAEYNGYKVYWEDGGQITDEIANAIKEEYDRIGDEIIVPNESLSSDQPIDVAILDDWYATRTLDSIMNRAVFLSEDERSNYKVLYSPLHGVGATVVPKYLERYSFATTLAQETVDGNFPSVPTAPNPEEAATHEIALATARNMDSKPDLVLLTDAGCDRVGVSILDYNTGEYKRLSGHEVGALLIDFLVRTRHHIASDAYVVKTFVTPDLGTRIAQQHGYRAVDVPTGFKHIGETIRQMKLQQGGTFLFGYEESCGYLHDDDVRDKCGIQAALLIADAGAYWKQRSGQSLLEVLNGIYRMFGFYAYDLMNLEVTDWMQGHAIEQFRTLGIEGYQLRIDGGSMLRFEHPEDSREFVAIRISGTEPKLKVYINTRRGRLRDAQARLNDTKELILRLLRERGIINETQRREARPVLRRG